MTQRTLNERYELETIVGRGGMAEVWRGYDRRLGRPVAVKVLRSDLASDDVFIERLRREARSVARLNHPGIVAIYDAGGDEVEGVLLPYLVMEYVDGRPLSHVLGDGERLTTERSLQVTMAILEALEFSHRAGFVHRDIKPANIMLTADDGVKVMDFGIARALASVSAELTKTAQVLGTARYLSPEQATGGAVDGRSDVYSTGCLLYELLTGRPPYTAENAMGVIGLHVQADVPRARDADWDVPEALSAIAARAMAKDPADRFQSAAEMRDALAAYLGVGAAPVAAASAAAPVVRRRGPAVLYGLAAAGVVLGIAGGSYLLTDRTAPVSDPRPANTAGADPAGGAAPADPATQGDDVSQNEDNEGSGNNRPPGPRPETSTGVTPSSTPAPGPAPTAPVPPPPGETSEPEPTTSPEPSPSPSDSDSPSPSPSPEPSESPEPSDSPSPTAEPSPTPTETDPPEPTNPAPTEPSTSTSPEPTSTGDTDRQA